MNNNRKIAVNSIVIFLRLCITSVVSLISSRVVLDALGASDYGLYNVVGGIMMLINVMNMSMSASTYRYFATEMGMGKCGNLNKIFNISFSNHAILALVILFLGLTAGEVYILFGLNVAPEKFNDALVIYHITVLSSFISTFLVPYSGLLIAFEKFTVTAILEIISILLRLGALLTLLYWLPNRLLCYSLIMFVTSAIQWGGYVFYSKKHYREIIKLKSYKDEGLYREMLSFAGWTSLGSFTNVAYTQVTAILINFFFGTIVNAAFAVGNQINGFITTFANSLNQASVPQITKSFSAGNFARSLNLTARVSKYTFFLMLLVSFPVLMELDFLLELWLKKVPDGANLYCDLICLAGLFNTISQGTSSMVASTGKIKFFQIVGVFTTTFTLLSGWLCFSFGTNAYALSAVICVMRFLGIIINVILLKRIINFDIRTFYNLAYRRMILLFIPLTILWAFYNPSQFTITGHIIGLFFSVLIVIVLILLLGLDKIEHVIIWKQIRKLTNRNSSYVHCRFF